MTDGVWLWNLGHAYYVEHHGWAFDHDFVTHVLARDYCDLPRLTAASSTRHSKSSPGRDDLA